MNPRGIESVVDHIAQSIHDNGSWRLSFDDFLDCVGIEQLEIYQTLYRFPDISLSGTLSGFSSEDPVFLLRVLEQFYGRKAEEALTVSGLFLPIDMQLDLLVGFIDTCLQAFSNHSIDYDEFKYICENSVNVFISADRYCIRHLHPPDYIATAVHEYLSNSGVKIPHAAALFGTKILRSYLRRGILEVEILTERIRAVLFDFAAAEELFGRRERVIIQDEDDRFLYALEIMELTGRRLNLAELKKNYKKLMMRFHPDINPDGLEHCKTINSAYSFLFGYLTQIANKSVRS